MRIIRDYCRWPGSLKGGVVAIGNFDGVHRGHQAVLNRLCEEATRSGTHPVVLSFEPHPRRYFQPDAPELRIMPFADKAGILREIGIEAVLAQRFDGFFSQLAAVDFMQCVLGDALAARKVITGEDFIFGHQRGGNALALAKFAEESAAFAYEAIAPVGNTGEGKFSSSKIREHLRQGEMALAAAMLGRPYRWCRPVIHGDKRGRTLGFPTANLLPPSVLLPRLGVYAVRAGVGERRGEGVANLGWRPSFGGQRVQLEVHLFDFDEDLYGKELTVELLAHLRDEVAFDGLPALKAQIAKDCAAARQALELLA